MKYLIEIHHGIGDVVQMTGVIESIYQADMDANIALIINKDLYRSLFKYDERVKEIFKIDLQSMSKRELIKVVFEMRRRHFDYFLLSPISNPRASRFLTKLIGARVSIGEQIVSKENRKIHITAMKNSHIVKRNENIVKALNFVENFYFPSLRLGNGAIQDKIMSNTIALCIGTSIPQKTWALENYLYIGKRFLGKGYNVVLLGGKKEEEELKNIKLPDKIVNFVGKTSLIETAQIAQKCKLTIGGDTGVMHMAAAVEATTLTLFSCTDPKLHAPYSNKSFIYNIDLSCQFCYETGDISKCRNYKCINNIKPENVYKCAIGILENQHVDKYKFDIRG